VLRQRLPPLPVSSRRAAPRRYAAEVVAASLGCGCGIWSAGDTSVELSARPESSCPLSFMAEVDMPGAPAGPLIAILVFTKASSTAPWLMTHVSGYGGTNPTLGPTTLSGPRESSANQAHALLLLDQLAQIFQAVRTTGLEPSGNLLSTPLPQAPGSEPEETLDTLGQDRISDQNAGIENDDTYSVEDPSAGFPTARGWVTCADTIGVATQTNTSGKPFVQPTSRKTYGSTLAPGSTPA
jgi:hypothetical protein